MDIPRLRFAVLPTPLHRLDALSQALGADIWIKRDDLTGFGCGGNKVRKAEFLLADAMEQGADAVVTAGAAQSNHARVIAAAAARYGLECHLVLSGQPPAMPTGNLLLNCLSRANLHFVPTGPERGPAMEALMSRLRDEGKRPYLIPIGGSNAVGARGYVDAFREIHDQLRPLPSVPTTVYFASSSGGTYGGLLAGRAACGSSLNLVAVRVDDDLQPEDAPLSLANSLAEQLSIDARFTASDLHFDDKHVGEGYGIPTTEGIEALKLLWRTEGILLDPVYTAKATAALISDARIGRLADRRAIFLHTGGAPSIFAAPTNWFDLNDDRQLLTDN